jgi:superfamily II DNA or RNA helicase
MATWRQLPLWPHQLRAVELASQYLDAASGRARLVGSALIRMPTGTGKSAVIAVITRCLTPDQSALVLTPSLALRRQLAQDIREDVWRDVFGISPDQWHKNVLELLPSTASGCLAALKKGPCILVGTIQTLHDLSSKPVYRKLRKAVSLVVFDEGHREPAPQWAVAVRAIDVPTVLLTATPYRNDHKMFEVKDSRFVFSYTHRHAEEARYLRDVLFIEETLPADPEAFVALLLRRCGEKMGGADLDKRVIVRCETAADVGLVAGALATAVKDREQVVAIHDTFDNEEERTSRVPDPGTSKAVYWVHQYKLLEGIDSPSFRFLALYKPLKNSRALVQQIGRVVRNPRWEQKQRQVAYVLADPATRQAAYWNKYREYEMRLDANPDLFESRFVMDSIVQLQPEWHYFERDFRDRLDLNEAPIHPHLRYRYSANVYTVRPDFDMKELNLNLVAEREKDDCDILWNETPPGERGSVFVLVYVTYQNSPVLLDRSLFEYRLAFTICRRAGRFLFVYDSEQNQSQWLASASTRVDPERLERLFAGPRARITNVSLLNMDLGRHAVRRRSMHAYDLAGTAPSLGDHAHVAATAAGHSAIAAKGLVRRYVGITRARVSDASPGGQTYDEYIQWLNRVTAVLSRDRDVLPVFQRYAGFLRPPAEADAQPVNILFDLDDVIDSFVLLDEHGEDRAPVRFDEICYDVAAGEFVCRVNGVPFGVGVEYLPDRESYQLTSPDLSERCLRFDPGSSDPRDNLIAHLNRTQSFRLVPELRGRIYTHGHFYEPASPLMGRKSRRSLDLLQIISARRQLTTITSEKGSANLRADGTSWHKDTVFGVTAGALTRDFGMLVCDDAGSNETCDFIAADVDARRIAFIHAKAGEGSSLSASVFHVLCGQAVKNLHYLHPYSMLVPPNKHAWDKPWKVSPIGTVASRIVRGAASASDAWTAMSDLIRDPATSREVWLVLGSGFSRSTFDKDRRSQKPAPETIQILYLLESTWNAVQAVGASFRVFCSP